jgi:nucleoside-diphosphate-sugar epimerase
MFPFRRRHSEVNGPFQAPSFSFFGKKLVQTPADGAAKPRAAAASGAQPPLVVVTGVSGYVGGVLAAYALAAGYRVRGTVRDAAGARAAAVRAALPGVQLVSAELQSHPDAWAAALSGATYVLHAASPVTTGAAADEASMVRPAVDGARAVLNAAVREPGVRRVVFTSSVAALCEGTSTQLWRSSKVFTEADWSQVTGSTGAGHPAYPVSKTLAEREAWEVVRMQPAGRGLELSVINPGLVSGPPATPGCRSSLELYTRLLNREMPAVPDLHFPWVDVRDVAVAHLRAMTWPDAAGQRFVCVEGGMRLRDLAALTRAELQPLGFSVATRPLPSVLLRLVGRFDPAVATALHALGRAPKLSHAKSVRELGFAQRPYRCLRSSVADTCRALVALGYVEDKSPGGTLSDINRPEVAAMCAYKAGLPGSGCPIEAAELEGVAWRASS